MKKVIPEASKNIKNAHAIRHIARAIGDDAGGRIT
jgi:hypothetical protein